MSDQPVSEPTVESNERSLGQEIVRESTIAFAASAAGVVGLLGGLVVFSKLADRKAKKPAGEHIATPESEPTES